MYSQLCFDICEDVMMVLCTVKVGRGLYCCALCITPLLSGGLGSPVAGSLQCLSSVLTTSERAASMITSPGQAQCVPSPSVHSKRFSENIFHSATLGVYADFNFIPMRNEKASSNAQY